MCLPLATAFTSVNRGTVFEGVSHLDRQSASEVTTSQPPNPLTALLASVLGARFPFSSFQKGSSATRAATRNTDSNANPSCFIRSNYRITDNFDGYPAY